MKLQFVNDKTDFIIETFGMDMKIGKLLNESMLKYFLNLMKADNVPTRLSKTSMLEKYLNSQEFKDFNLPEDINNAFVLGYIFFDVNRRTQNIMTKEQLDEIMTHLMSHVDNSDEVEESAPN